MYHRFSEHPDQLLASLGGPDRFCPAQAFVLTLVEREPGQHDQGIHPAGRVRGELEGAKARPLDPLGASCRQLGVGQLKKERRGHQVAGQLDRCGQVVDRTFQRTRGQSGAARHLQDVDRGLVTQQVAQLCVHCRPGWLNPHGQETAHCRSVKAGPLGSLERLVQCLGEQRVGELDFAVVLGVGQARIDKSPQGGADLGVANASHRRDKLRPEPGTGDAGRFGYQDDLWG